MILYPLPSSCHLICHLAGQEMGLDEKNLKMIQQKSQKKHVPMQLAARFPVHFVSSLRYIWGFPKMVGDPNKPMGVPTKNDQHLGCEMGVPPFKETPISCLSLQQISFASGPGTLEFRSQSRRSPVLCPNQPVHTF